MSGLLSPPTRDSTSPMVSSPATSSSFIASSLELVHRTLIGLQCHTRCSHLLQDANEDGDLATRGVQKKRLACVAIRAVQPFGCRACGSRRSLLALRARWADWSRITLGPR